jgi:hypothetical protein
VITGRADALAFWGPRTAAWPGVILLVVVMFWLYKVIVGGKQEA